MRIRVAVLGVLLASLTFAIVLQSRSSTPAPAIARHTPAEELAFNRAAITRTAHLYGRRGPNWKRRPAFHGSDVVPTDPATGHAYGDWTP